MHETKKKKKKKRKMYINLGGATVSEKSIRFETTTRQDG
jgi:hypothetical protein